LEVLRVGQKTISPLFRGPPSKRVKNHCFEV
jgi:hypothetical protein